MAKYFSQEYVNHNKEILTPRVTVEQVISPLLTPRVTLPMNIVCYSFMCINQFSCALLLK